MPWGCVMRIERDEMAHKKRFAGKGAALLSAAVLMISALTVSTGFTAPPAQAASNTVDFENGTWDPWVKSGDPTLSVIESPDGDSQVLSVADRKNDYDGISSPSNLEPGQTYNLSMKVRLAAGTEGTANIYFVFKGNYKHIGDPSVVSADAWTTVDATYPVPADNNGTPFDPSVLFVYIGSDNMDGLDSYTYLVDDLTVAAPPAEVTVEDVNFEDGTWDEWVKSGGPTLSVIESPDGDSQVLSVADRKNDYDGISSPSELVPGQTYTMSMKARLAPGTVGTANIDFVFKGNYKHFGSPTTVSADEWTTVTGTYTVPADNNGTPFDPSTLFVYIGAADIPGLDSYSYLVDDILITTPAPATEVAPGISTGFEDGPSGWIARDGATGSSPTVAISTQYFHNGKQAACVTNRTSTGDGIGYVTDNDLTVGVAYTLTAWVRFEDGQSTDGGIWLSNGKSVTGQPTIYSTLSQFDPVANDGWTKVQASVTMPPADSNLLYFETNYNLGTNFSDFCVDDISIEPPTTAPDMSLEPIKDADMPFPVGVAVSQPQIIGQAADLLLHHFNQVTPENDMKEGAWYDDNGNFRMSPVAEQIMQFAQDNDIRVYGHNLVWYEGSNNSTPDWFFNVSPTDDRPLTNSAADQAILKQRLHDHIFGIAKALSDEFGLFGSDTNKLVAFDVVNEAIAESASPETGGLRNSEWYQILGPDFINLAFQYADEAFNTPTAKGGYADPSANRPVKLFINDFNTENSDKRAIFHDVVEQLVAEGVPVDGVGNQFHMAQGMTTSVSSLQAALESFADLKTVTGAKMLVAVTELDAPTGTPVSEPLLINQGYYYKAIFDTFRQFAADYPDQLFSVTMWGLDDAQSWQNSKGAPLPFDENLQAKYAYYGIIDAALPPTQLIADIFGTDSTTGDLSATAAGVDSTEWAKLPLKPVVSGGSASYELRWSPDTLYAYVTVDDPVKDAGDKVTFQVGDTTYVVNRDGTTAPDIAAYVVERAGGYTLVAHLPLNNDKYKDLVNFGLSVNTVQSDAQETSGTITLTEPLSFVEIPEALAVPTIDGKADDTAWTNAAIVTTGISSSTNTNPSPATAQVRLLWSDDTLYVLMHVTDPSIDVSSSNNYEQDSVEIYVDRGNQKSMTYTSTDTQMRINVNNFLSVGTYNDEPGLEVQATWLDSATSLTDDGYIVEAAISLQGKGGLGTYQGLDFQVNDGTAGHRTAIQNWANPTDNGYQSPYHLGVGLLVPAVSAPSTEQPAETVKTGGTSSVAGSALPILAAVMLLAGAGIVTKRKFS